jgi:hypothetical protein
MDHRNRWFTVLKNGGSFHGKLSVITRWYIHILYNQENGDASWNMTGMMGKSG